MIGVLMLGIAVSALVIGGLGLVVFVDAAFGGARKLHDHSLPLLKGESLQAWAASRGQMATEDWLASRPDRSHPDELALRIEADAGQLLDEAVFRESPAGQGPQRCREGEIVPRVTAPEVFAIALELRKLPLRRQEDLKRQISSARAEPGDCPLLTAQGMCLCAAARPLGCRGRCLAGFDSSVEAAKWAETLEAGLIEGMQQMLGGAGLDGARYRLNAALASVLSDPAAESRWRRGQTLMATTT